MLSLSSMASLRALVFGFGRGRSVRPRQRPARSRPGLESLEDRLAPTAQIYLDSHWVLHIDSDNTGNTITLTATTTHAIVTVNNEPPHQIDSPFTFAGIQMNGGTGADRLSLYALQTRTTVNGNSTTTAVVVGHNGSLSAISASVSVNGTTALTVDGSSDTNNETVQMNAASLTGMTPLGTAINYGSVLSLTVRTGTGRNTINVTGTPRTGVLYGGVTLTTRAVSDTVNVQGITAPISIPPFTYLLGGPLTVNCQAPAGVTVGNNGSLQGIGSSLTINQSGFSRVDINDGADNANHPNVILTDTSLTGLAPATIYYHTPDNFDYLNITVGNGNNTYTIVNTSGATTLNTGNGNDTVIVQGTATYSPLTVNAGGTSHDGVNVGNNGSLAGINGALTLNNALSWSHVNINDVADNAAHPNVTLTANSLTGLAPAPITFQVDSLDGLNISAGNGNNNYTVVNTVYSSATGGNRTILNTGTGNDTVNVQGTVASAPLTVEPGANVNDVVNVGYANSLAGINGEVAVSSFSWCHLNINDGADTAAHPNVMLTGISLTGLAPALIDWSSNSLDGLTITAGNGNNTYTVVTTPYATVAGGDPTVLNTGAGRDTVNVQGTTASAPLTVNNAGSSNQVDNLGSGDTLTALSGAVTLNNTFSYTTVYVNDGSDNTNHPSVALSASSLTGLAPAPINFGPTSLLWLYITVGNGTDNYTLTTPQAYLGTTLATGTGANTVTVTDTGGPVNLAGNPAGSNTLIGPNATTTWNITAANAGSFSGTGTLVSFTNYQNLTGGSGGNTFVFSDAATLSGTLNGGSGGTNTLDSSAYTTPESFAISGANAGSGTPVGAFSNIQSLLGGRGGNNGFAFNDGGSLGVSLNGGSGLGNTLDYSTGWTGNVTVDLPLGVASGIANPATGAVGGIQNVVGASGGGSGLYNLLIGNGGNFLQGGTGRRNLLVAGATPSTLVGGDGEDLLIAGSTNYDGDPTLANWQAIASYWTSADPFATRVANLLSGSGVPILDPTPGTGTVVGNNGGSALIGNGGLALIYADTLDQGSISGFDPGSQLETITP
jgi:hypothetical protein